MNAQKELLNALGTGVMPKCAKIIFEVEKFRDIEIILKVNYSVGDWTIFLDRLGRVEYNNGYGRQQLFGTVWINDRTWLERGEYDGSEWWERKVYPTIPNKCM